MTERSLGLRRVLEFVGLLMIGDGALAAAKPTRHTELWIGGPRFRRRYLTFFAERPGLTRALGIGELMAGLWIASRQQEAAV